MKISALIAVSFFLATSASQAQFYPSPGQMPPLVAPQQVQTQNPFAGLMASIQQLMAVLKRSGGNMPPQQITAFLDQNMGPYFDFAGMARLAAGPMAKQMKEKDLAELATRIKWMFFGKVTEKLAGTSGTTVNFLPPRMGRDGKTASAGVQVPTGMMSSVRLDFRMHQTQEGWKVFDVVANGQSALAFLRQQLVGQLRGANPALGRPY